MFDGHGDPFDALQVGASRAFTALCPRQRGRQQNWQQSDDVNEAKPPARGIGSLGISASANLTPRAIIVAPIACDTSRLSRPARTTIKRDGEMK